MGNQGGDGVIVEGAGIDAAADRQGDEQDGTAEWVFLRACRGTRGQLQEFLGDRSGTIEGSVWHTCSVRRIVQCSKKESRVPHGDDREPTERR